MKIWKTTHTVLEHTDYSAHPSSIWFAHKTSLHWVPKTDCCSNVGKTYENLYWHKHFSAARAKTYNQKQGKGSKFQTSATRGEIRCPRACSPLSDGGGSHAHRRPAGPQPALALALAPRAASGVKNPGRRAGHQGHVERGNEQTKQAFPLLRETHMAGFSY